MGIGLYRGIVTLEKHNPEWIDSANKTIEKLKQILGSTARDIEHIGSTAIKNICAKPIIDIVIGVTSLDNIIKYNNILEENGFSFRGEDHPNQLLYVCGKGDFITHHIHVAIYDSQVWHNYINIRDYLNTHETDAKNYDKLKEKLAKEYANDRKTYTLKKSDMLNEIIKKASNWRKGKNDIISN